eukprot:m.58546 g.58546  ORF g.58546 m.58546 type:complete len:605 (+) comp11701_c0_seq1:171-1985(+)
MKWLVFAADARALVLFRLMLGLFALTEIYTRATMPGGLFWYTEDTLATADTAPPLVHGLASLASTDSATCSLMLFLACFCGIMLILGTQWRAAAAGLYVSLFISDSIQPMMVSTESKLFTNLLLCALFMDLNPQRVPMPPKQRAYTNNAIVQFQEANDNKLVQTTSGTVALCLQIACMYATVCVKRLAFPTSWQTLSAMGYLGLASTAMTAPSVELTVNEVESQTMVANALIFLVPLLHAVSGTRHWRRALLVPLALTAHWYANVSVSSPHQPFIYGIQFLPFLPTPFMDYLETNYSNLQAIWQVNRQSTDVANNELTHMPRLSPTVCSATAAVLSPPSSPTLQRRAPVPVVAGKQLFARAMSATVPTQREEAANILAPTSTEYAVSMFGKVFCLLIVCLACTAVIPTVKEPWSSQATEIARNINWEFQWNELSADPKTRSSDNQNTFQYMFATLPTRDIDNITQPNINLDVFNTLRAKEMKDVSEEDMEVRLGSPAKPKSVADIYPSQMFGHVIQGLSLLSKPQQIQRIRAMTPAICAALRDTLGPTLSLHNWDDATITTAQFVYTVHKPSKSTASSSSSSSPPTYMTSDPLLLYKVTAPCKP